MYCGSTEGHSEVVDTGDPESFEGFENWLCCHNCRDKKLPCETFHKIESNHG
jgi:hypothetical protein